MVPGSPCYKFDSMSIWVQCYCVKIRVVFVSVLSSHSCSVEYYVLYLVCLCSLYEIYVIIFQSFLISECC